MSEKYWYTFGEIHGTNLHGVTINANTILEVEGSAKDTRDKMFQLFNNKWDAQYDAGEIDLRQYPDMRVVKLRDVEAGTCERASVSGPTLVNSRHVYTYYPIDGSSETLKSVLPLTYDGHKYVAVRHKGQVHEVKWGCLLKNPNLNLPIDQRLWDLHQSLTEFSTEGGGDFNDWDGREHYGFGRTCVINIGDSVNFRERWYTVYGVGEEKIKIVTPRGFTDYCHFSQITEVFRNPCVSYRFTKHSDNVWRAEPYV